MTKEEFLKKLEQKLMVINDDERADMLLEYQQHLEMKIASGLSEEQAIEDFGDFDELVKEILDAYHINTAYDSTDNFRHKLNYYMQSFANFLTSLTSALLEKDKRSLGELLLKFLGLMIFLFLFRGLLEMGSSMFYALISILPHFISSPLHYLLNFIVSLLHFALSIYLIVFFIKKYVLIDYQPLEPPISSSNETIDTFNTVKQKTHEFKERMLTDEQVSDFGGRCSDSCLCILGMLAKTIATLILIPAALALLCLAIACGTLMVFALQGFSVVGIIMILLGSILIGGVCCASIFNLVFAGGLKR